jgi:hypothetical protein
MVMSLTLFYQIIYIEVVKCIDIPKMLHNILWFDKTKLQPTLTHNNNLQNKMHHIIGILKITLSYLVILLHLHFFAICFLACFNLVRYYKNMSFVPYHYDYNNICDSIICPKLLKGVNFVHFASPPPLQKYACLMWLTCFID